MENFKAFLNAVQLHSVARNGYRDAARVMRGAGDQGKGVGLEGALVSIIFSVASLEAFIAEVPFLIDVIAGKNLSLGKLAAILHEAEDSQLQVRGKYLIAKGILGDGFDRGRNPYQDFDLLVRIRNEIIHMKPDVIGDSPHKLVRALTARKLCDPSEAPNNSWVDQIATLPTAKWACNVAAGMVRGLCTNDDGTENTLAAITSSSFFVVEP